MQTVTLPPTTHPQTRTSEAITEAITIPSKICPLGTCFIFNIPTTSDPATPDEPTSHSPTTSPTTTPSTKKK